MEDLQSPIRLPFYARLSLVLLCVTLILLLMEEAKAIIIPLFFSLLIAFMLLPFTKWLESKRIPRSVATIISIFSFLIIVGGLISFLTKQISDFSKDIPQLGVRIQTWTGELRAWVNTNYHVDYSHQIEYINKAGAGIVSYASVIAPAFFLGLSGFIIWTIFVFIFTFFILTHRGLLKKFIICLFSDKHHSHVNEVMQETKQLANSYVVGLLIEMVIVAVVNCIALAVFGVKYALLLGILAAVLNIIPYIGIYTATGIAAVVTLSNSSPGKAVSVIVILIIVHFIDANILMPRIVGSRVKMNPLITIIAVLAGSLLWGISGTFLFIPLAAILKFLFERVEGFKPWAILLGTDG